MNHNLIVVGCVALSSLLLCGFVFLRPPAMQSMTSQFLLSNQQRSQRVLSSTNEEKKLYSFNQEGTHKVALIKSSDGDVLGVVFTEVNK